MTKQEFLTAAIAAATEVSRQSGLLAGVTVAQAALESAWGKSQLSLEANNYFGIKAHGERGHLEMPTAEVKNGIATVTTARFAKYASMVECFADRDRLINSLACYEEARKHAGDVDGFVHALAKHWATDPDYAEKVLRTYRANKLYLIDQTTTQQ